MAGGARCVGSQGPHGNGTFIAVGDDGIGLPLDFEKRATRSLGYQVVTLLTEQMGGTIHYESRPGEGTRFELTIVSKGEDITA